MSPLIKNHFRTEINIEPSSWNIGYEDKLITIGSCFSEEIGNKLNDAKFKCLPNPMGTLFNPVSINKNLLYSLSGVLDENHFLKRDDTWLNYDFHSDFQNISKDKLKHSLSEKLALVSKWIKNSNYLIITWGTSLVYTLNDKIVANCHKMPQNLFSKRMLTAEEILNDFKHTHQKLQEINPNINIILTVSPVRHIKDTIPLNSASKALLRYSAHLVSEQFKNVEYFPSFEICMDDLRDYRFYKDDFIHPNELAVDYIWNHFQETYFDNKTKGTLQKWNKIKKSMMHKPFNTQSNSFKKFLNGLLISLKEIQNELDVNKEIRELEQKIKTQFNEHS